MSKTFSLLRWVLWNLAGGVVAPFVLFFLYNGLRPVGNLIGLAVGLAVVGAIWGTCQYFGLRKILDGLRPALWIGMSALGMTVGALLGLRLFSPVGATTAFVSMISMTLLGATIGLLTGLAQWVEMRLRREKAPAWVVWSVIGGAAGIWVLWLVGMLLGRRGDPGVALTLITAGIPVSLVYALATGAFFRPQKAPEATADPS